MFSKSILYRQLRPGSHVGVCVCVHTCVSPQNALALLLFPAAIFTCRSISGRQLKARKPLAAVSREMFVFFVSYCSSWLGIFSFLVLDFDLEGGQDAHACV